MALNLAKLAQLGTKTAAKVGAAANVMLVRTTRGALDPVTDLETESTMHYPVRNATVAPYRPNTGLGMGEGFEAGSLRITNGRILTFAALDCPVTPALGDRWQFGGHTWTTTHVSGENPTGAAPLSWTVGVTR